MQRFLLALFSFGLIATTVLAQGARTIPGFVPQRIAALTASGVNFQHRSLLAPVAKSAATDEPWRSVVRNANVFSLDHAATAQVLMDRPAFVALDISSNEGMITLDLERVDFTTDDFSVITASTGATVNYMQGVHYRGAVHGDPNSLVAISIFKNEVMGIVSAGDGDRVIGKLDGDAQDRHIIYRVSDLLDPALPVCGTVDDGQGYSADQLTIQEGDRTVKCVRL